MCLVLLSSLSVHERNIHWWVDITKLNTVGEHVGHENGCKLKNGEITCQVG